MLVAFVPISSLKKISNDAILQDMLSGLNGMDKIFVTLERTMDEMISRQQDVRIFNERLSIERSKVKSLEQEIDQLRSQVALLQSKVRTSVRTF